MELIEIINSAAFKNLSKLEQDKLVAAFNTGDKPTVDSYLKKGDIRLKSADIFGKATNAIAGTTQVLTDDYGVSTSAEDDLITGSEKNKKIAGDALKSGATMAGAFSSFGPIGTAAGFVGGSVIGAIKGKKEVIRANKAIKEKQFDKERTKALGETYQEEAEYESAIPRYMKRGGFVKGKGGPTSDNVDTTLNKNDYVMPAATEPVTKKAVRSIAKKIGETKPISKTENKEQKVKLSPGELVIPKNKVGKAEKSANDIGTSLEGLRSRINKKNEKKREEIKIGSGTVKHMAKGGPVDYSEYAQNATALSQVISGLVQKKKSEKEIQKSIDRQEKRLSEQVGQNIKTKALKDKNVNLAFRDTQDTIKRLKQETKKTMLQNARTPQEFSTGMAGVTSALGDTVSKANIEKQIQLNQNEADFSLSNTEAKRELNQLEDQKSSFYLAKAMQGASTAQAGTQNLYDLIEDKRNDARRRRTMNQLIAKARAYGIEIENIGNYSDEDIKQLKEKVEEFEKNK